MKGQTGALKGMKGKSILNVVCGDSEDNILDGLDTRLNYNCLFGILIRHFYIASVRVDIGRMS